MSEKYKVLIAEDDSNDFEFINQAFESSNVEIEIKRMIDGEELIDFLLNLKSSFIPDIVIVDISMPKKDGFQVLEEIKKHKDLKIIPIIIMTTSNQDTDMYLAYSLGANSFITKPDNFESLLDVVNIISKYWFEKVSIARNWVDCEEGSE